MAKKENRKNNQTGLALACWILGFLVLLIVFLIKQDDIYSNLKTTRFFERLFGKTPTFIENHEVKKGKTPAEEEIVINLNSKEDISDDKTSPKNIGDITSPKEIKPSETVVSEKPVAVKDEKNDLIANATVDKKIDDTVAKVEPVKPTLVNQKLYFVYVGEDGVLSRKMITRQVEKNNSPLLTNVNLLLKGPIASESSRGYRSLVPNRTKLLSASVRDGVAYLNFNEDFEFNTLGPDGYYAQLMQIVYTATEFSTVNSVQFLIEGQKKEYLGSEGVWIGSPLSRASFN